MDYHEQVDKGWIVMKMHADVTCTYGDERVSRAVAKALEPDNLRLPEGLTVSTRVRGKNVVTSIELYGRMETLLATIDDLLACTLTSEIML